LLNISAHRQSIRRRFNRGESDYSEDEQMRLNSRRLAVNGKRLAALYSSRVSAEIHSMLGRFLLFTLMQYVKTDRPSSLTKWQRSQVSNPTRRVLFCAHGLAELAGWPRVNVLESKCCHRAHLIAYILRERPNILI
jgi:hypothetical protein